VRPKATTSGDSSSTAIAMKRYGMPQIAATARSRIQAFRGMPG
jgi:hypothetical protein